LDVLATMEPESIDAVVTDPPYGLAFMGKEWDHGVPGEPFWRAAFRVAKPGAHLLAFGGTRTFHRLAVAIEDAGWEIRDCLSWLYGSGFPKSLDVSKAIDKAKGAEREVVGDRVVSRNISEVRPCSTGAEGRAVVIPVTAPATDLARAWEGWGTALKPAWEPIILARKPLRGTVAANVERFGTGALHVDACRIGDGGQLRWERPRDLGYHGGTDNGPCAALPSDKGRWPANVVIDEDVAEAIDRQSGASGSANSGSVIQPKPEQERCHGEYGPRVQFGYEDFGGASRFFYTAKASREEREAGLRDLPVREVQSGMAGAMPTDDEGRERDRFKVRARNVHPTVKPLDLMRWCVRLIAPIGAIVLDPFMGSGTTGVAAHEEGCGFVGIDREAEYVAIARGRIAFVQAQPRLF
jgi:site-specific DNA-methyltransferase (adenine-specific)